MAPKPGLGMGKKACERDKVESWPRASESRRQRTNDDAVADTGRKNGHC